jgi:hypothetical protein
MPAPLIALFIAGALVAVAVTFWSEICEWYSRHARPWLERHLPGIAPYVHDAFVFLDKLAVAARRAVREAWKRVRPHILQAVVEFRQSHDGVWIRRIESYLQAEIARDAPVVKVTEEREMNWDELPESVRAAALERRRAAPVDFVQTRDREVFAMEMS